MMREMMWVWLIFIAQDNLKVSPLTYGVGTVIVAVVFIRLFRGLTAWLEDLQTKPVVPTGLDRTM